MSGLGRLFVGGGFFAGAIGIISLFVTALAPLKEFKEAFELYAKYVRKPLANILDINAVPFSIYALDIVVVWLALFLAINAFAQRQDGLFLWGHIGRAYCVREKQSLLARWRCVLPKFVYAFLAAPVVCLVATWHSVAVGEEPITMSYMTIEPRLVAKYIGALFGLSTLVIIALKFLSQP